MIISAPLDSFYHASFANFNVSKVGNDCILGVHHTHGEFDGISVFVMTCQPK